jgi:hypothetical protein
MAGDLVWPVEFETGALDRPLPRSVRVLYLGAVVVAKVLGVMSIEFPPPA